MLSPTQLPISGSPKGSRSVQHYHTREMVFSVRSLVAYCVLTVRAIWCSCRRGLASKLFHETLLLGLSINDGGKREKEKKNRGREIIANTSSLSSNSFSWAQTWLNASLMFSHKILYWSHIEFWAFIQEILMGHLLGFICFRCLGLKLWVKGKNLFLIGNTF